VPTYVYVCESCGHKFELFHAMSDEPYTVCSKCKGNLRRLPGGGAAVIFKGDGFYETDYKQKDPGKGKK